MNIRDLKRRYYLLRLREARGLLAVGAIVVVALTLFVVFAATRPAGSVDPFNHPYSRDPETICSTHGEGAVVCRPAPEGVKRYRERLRAENTEKAQ